MPDHSDGLSLPGINRVSGPLRATAILTAFAALTAPLMPVQYALLKMAPKSARRLPFWYHRAVCRLLGIRIRIEGEVARDRPVLIVSNHISWLDIPILSAVAPLSFIAKKEVGTWPVVSNLARLQRTVFVDRTRRTAVGHVTSEMRQRLDQGDILVLFAEGTSTDGNRVLPFKTALFAAAFSEANPNVCVQSLSLTYTRLHGIPLGRADRNLIGWYGDMEMGDHAWSLLKAGPIDVRISIGDPIPLSDFADRKQLAEHTEMVVRRKVTRHLREL
ncbi:MAG: lysophospholipid acyltransferase family protein [Hyphomicrobiaceae bacterium]